MGLRGPIKRRDGRMHLELVEQPTRIGKAPAPPARWTKGENTERMLVASLREWDRLWASDIAQFWKPSDVAIVERLVEAEDERLRLRRACRKERLVPGSMGQPTLNPLNSALKDAVREIQWLEDRLGLNPASRQRLGLQKLAGAKTAAELNALVDGQDANGDSQDEDELGLGTRFVSG